MQKTFFLHPIYHLNSRTETSNSSLAVIIISTFRRKIKSRFYFSPEDLDRIPKSLANNIKDDPPFPIRSENLLSSLEDTHKMLMKTMTTNNQSKTVD